MRAVTVSALSFAIARRITTVAAAFAVGEVEGGAKTGAVASWSSPFNDLELSLICSVRERVGICTLDVSMYATHNAFRADQVLGVRGHTGCL